MLRAKKIPSTVPTEYQEQCDLIAWCDRHQDLRVCLIYSHLNGMRTGLGTAIKAKRSGARNGIPDLFLPVPSNGYHGLYIELKRLKGGVVSAEQKAWGKQLKLLGYQWVLCRGCNEAKLEIAGYLGN
jgi:VRR-NUC domain